MVRCNVKGGAILKGGYRQRKKLLTKEPKIFYNSSKTFRHCGQNIAFLNNDDNGVYVQCRTCKKWVKLNIVEEA